MIAEWGIRKLARVWWIVTDQLDKLPGFNDEVSVISSEQVMVTYDEMARLSDEEEYHDA